MISKSWILSIGVNDYGNQPEVPNLDWGVSDACLIFDTFINEFNFEGMLVVQKRDIPETFRNLRDFASGTGTRGDIISGINALRRKMGPEDTFVFFYSGHSLNGSATLIPFGGILNKISSHLLYADLCAELAALPCRNQLLFFDCCHSGAVGAIPHVIYIEDRNIAYFSALSEHNNQELMVAELVPCTVNGEHSLFAEVLNTYLQGLPAGQFFCPNELQVKIAPEYSKACPNKISVFRPEVPEIWPVTGPIELQKPGMAILMESKGNYRAGESFELKFNLKVNSGDEFNWELIPVLKEFKPTVCINIDPGKWELQMDSPGLFPFMVKVTDASQNSVSKSIDILVRPGRAKMLSIDPRPLQACLEGTVYEAQLQGEGGQPPYKWDIKGLPNGFSFCEKTGTINGFAEETPDAGTADSHSKTPVVYILNITLTDFLGNSTTTQKPLALISKDYCLIEGGDFEVGFTFSTHNDEVLRQMAKDLTYDAVKANGYNPNTIETVAPNIFNKHITDKVKWLKTELSQSNSGAKAHISDYYIKKYPVTNREWHEFVMAHPEQDLMPGHWNGTFPNDKARLPVSGISYKAISAYLKWRGTRLPNAWEFERAARGRNGRLFPWGNEFNHNKCNVLKPGSVGEVKPVNNYDNVYAEVKNDEGVRDLVGNVSEWIERRVYSGGCLVQVFRGGSFVDECTYALSFRDGRDAGLLLEPRIEDTIRAEADTARCPWIGFRDIIDLQADPEKSQGFEEIPACDFYLRDNRQQVKRFYMARYQVSNLEYLDFVRATGTRYPTGWQHSTNDIPFPWDKRHFPVVNISFYEAMAFCLWKSRETGEIIRIPTLEQWAAAVTNAGQTKYPWGDTYNLQMCNSRDSGWGRRLPVHALPPHDKKYFRIFNLVGNVNEWISPSKMCGGSWQDDCRQDNFASSGFVIGIKNPNKREWRWEGLGFRYVNNCVG